MALYVDPIALDQFTLVAMLYAAEAACSIGIYERRPIAILPPSVATLIPSSAIFPCPFIKFIAERANPGLAATAATTGTATAPAITPA